ncbi:thioredoxin [Cupriavidus gilardii J11]|uniref:Thioredoxin n=1 Tax=Cupriavidus gilardii J11 TaxID=936133 RepID=A0A562B7F9_9BURK|nr:thioredoxin [Cupriavidus gilardii]TWG80978.1 thioredoxin [Cupriavidus gilardii J11]
MSDVTLQNFETDVIALSRRIPVLVDFWAPWCGPCRTLGPMLEKLEQASAGKWKLAKINVDENQELAAHFGVRSIPHVIAFVDGKAVDQFVGVLPESGLREFIARVTPNPGQVALRQAREANTRGDRNAAREAYQAALAFDPGFDEARLDYIGFLLDGNEVDDAEAQMKMLTPRAAQHDGFAAVQTRLQALRGAAELPDETTLKARIDADPRDLQARLDLARLWIARRQYEPALEQLLRIVQTDRAFEDDVGRKTMLSVFEMMGDTPEAVSRWRRQLSAALN